MNLISELELPVISPSSIDNDERLNLCCEYYLRAHIGLHQRHIIPQRKQTLLRWRREHENEIILDLKKREKPSYKFVFVGTPYLFFIDKRDRFRVVARPEPKETT